MNQDVEKLWELQTVLTALHEREKQLNSKPESFAAIDREWEAANAEMEGLQQQIDTLTKERRRVDGELSDQQELLKKYQGQLMQVKNQQQYAAAWKEIDATRKHVKELEDSELKTMTEIEGLQKKLDDDRGSSSSLKERWDAEHDKWQHSLGDLRSEAEALRARAETLESALPDRVRPALYQQLKRGEMVFCEGCHRILYLEPVSS
jgi:predicted  nucleic acid-binding Zn-ribbon protein